MRGANLLLRRIAARQGVQLVPNDLVLDLRRWGGGAPHSSAEPVPPDAADFLRPDNPRLAELRERYARHPIGANVSLWSADYIAANVEMSRFRADSAYRWQSRFGMAPDVNDELHKVPTREINYVVTAQYVREHDRLGLLEVLKDDGLFGNCIVDVDGCVASTDRFDSLLQLDFLDRHIGLRSLRDKSVVDIGAGYGRFAHRLAQAMPDVANILCTDAVAESTFLCEYYLRFRGVDAVTSVVPLDEIEDALVLNKVMLAVNMHSFPEMPLSSIEWWLRQLTRNSVQYLMIVPNAFNRTAREADGTTPSFEPAIAAAGYELIAEEPKYLQESVQRHGVYPGEHLLYELKAS